MADEATCLEGAAADIGMSILDADRYGGAHFRLRSVASGGLTRDLTNPSISVIFCRHFLRLSYFYPARGDNATMATKTKVTKESTPKAAKTASPAPAPEKRGVGKGEKGVPAPGKKAPAIAPESAKSAPPLKAAVAPTSPQAAAVTAQDQRWLEIRGILEKLKEDTLREIRKSVKNGTEAVAAIEPGGDIYDQASSERDRELGLLLGDREREKIHSIDEALLRIDEGEYGICEECDEDIPLGRLKAMPFTRHCVKCKSDLEKLQAQTKRVEEERAYREIPLGSEEEE